MNRASILAFGITAAVLAAVTWSDTTLTADGETATPLNTLRADGVTFTVETREVDLPDEGRTITHLFLVGSGSGRGSLSLNMEKMGGNPMSRVPMASTVVWERSIPYDLAGGTMETDLGPLPGSQTKSESVAANPFRGSNELLATTDGSSWVALWTERQRLDLLVERLDHVNPSEPVKADE